MQYNFKGKYNATQNYLKKDVVSYQPTANDQIKFYFCLADILNTNPQTPSPSGDTQFWGLLNTSSNFPNSVDTFLYRSPIQASDKSDIERIQELNLKPTLSSSEQDELAVKISKQRDKLFLAEDANAIQQALSNLQMFYLSNTEGHVATIQAQLQAELDKFNHKGEYNASVQYRKRNTVTFQGETYLSLIDSINQTPNSSSDTIYWAKIAKMGAKGDKGEPGVGLRNAGAWSATKQYYVDDAVQYGGQIYACIQNNIGIAPNQNQDTAFWTLAISRGPSTFVSSFESITVVNNKTTNVQVNIPEYNSATDVLTVIKNTTHIVKGSNYKINPNGTSIDSLEGNWDGTETPINFHFLVYKNFVANVSYADGTMIQNSTISKAKLNVALQAEIDAKATKTELTAAVGNLNQSITTTNDNLSAHIADYTANPKYAATAGSANSYTITPSPAIPSYVDGMAFAVKINVDNTGASTINVNGKGNKSIVKSNGNAVVAGNLKAGSIYTIRYNGTNFILQGEGGDLSDADLASFITSVNSILNS